MTKQIKPLLSCDIDLEDVNFPVYVSKKLDGCFSWGTGIWTEKGIIPIGKIVDEKLDIKVASYNEVNKIIEFKKVVNWFNNGDKPKNQWLTFGKNYITDNHKVYANGDWVSSKDYNSGGIFINPNIDSILTGMLLGDSVAVMDKRHNLSWRLSWSNSVKDEQYGNYKLQMLKNIFEGRVINKKYKLSGYGKPIAYYVTPSCTKLPFDLSKFYVIDRSDENYCKRKKDLTLDDLSSFNELSLAIWFFDDGNINYNNGNINTPRLTISVPRYSDKTHEVFKKVFKKVFNVNPSIKRYGKDASMTFNTPDTWYLLSMISRVAGGMCSRKIPDVFNNENIISGVELLADDIKTIGNRLNVKNTDKVFTAYDIEVDGNHNYFANGMLVHNCRCLIIDGVAYSRSLKPIGNKFIQSIIGKQEYNGLDGELIVGNVYDKDVFQKTTSGVIS